jgi:long-chain acyl-CoA synthetase
MTGNRSRNASLRLTAASRRPALLEAWARTVRRFGSARAVIEAATGTTVTFAALDARAEAWRARHVPDPGALAGRLVVFAVPNGIAWFEIFLGLVSARAIVVPIDPAEPPASQRRIAEALRAAAWWDGGQLVPLARSRRFRDPRLCLVKLTSGTTGAPRPLFFTAAQMLADGRQVAVTMGIRARDLNYALIPFGHSYGLGNLVLPLVAQGVPLVCGAVALPHAIAADFARWRPTVFPSVPAIWRAMAEADLPARAFASLRVAISAGAPLPIEVARQFADRRGHRLHSFYGSSETGGITYDRTGAATLAGGVGTALRGVAVTARRGQRIQVCSAAVFTHGNRRIASGAGCCFPPDRARIDRQGQITLLGRRDATVKLAGRRVNLGEIVSRLRGLAGVRDAWVTVSADAAPVLGAALLTGRPVADLRRDLMADTAAWKIPKRWAILDEFPLTARGKVDRWALHHAVFGG